MLRLLNSAQNKFHKQLLFTNNSTVKKGDEQQHGKLTVNDDLSKRR